MNNLKILIFGAGEITNLLIKELIFKGKKVICVTDNSFNQIDNLSHTNLEILSYKEILSKKLEVDKVIFSWKDINRLSDNDQSIRKWLESHMFQANKSFHLSSASVYKDSISPQDESSTALENNKKLELEYILKEITIKKGIFHTDLRISNVYGIDISYGFIGSLFNSIKSGNEVGILQDLNITRDYIHVNDVIYAIQMIIEINTHVDCLNISTGIGTSISQVLEIFTSKGYNFENRVEISNEIKVKKFSILDCKNLSEVINWQPSSLTQVLNRLLPINLP
jgi:nucleoside-diphosphate-sugar epimerase